MKYFILICFLLIEFLSFSQTKDTITMAYMSVQNYEMNVNTIKKIQNPEKQYFEGSYHFGESENESQLDILFSNGKFYARTDYYNWEINNWVARLDRLSISYLDDKVTIDATEYELANANNKKGLTSHFYETEGGKTIHYIQFNTDGLLEKPKGKYPESGFVKLTTKDLEDVSKTELKLMRNELFARQGYTFNKGGEMDTYFSKQDWYNLIPKKTTLDFNAIEKHNIALISEIEKTNNNSTSNSIELKEQIFRDTIIIDYKTHKTLLNILKIVPKTTMRSWGWSKKDRIKTVNFIEKHNYLIDSTEMYQNIKYIQPNTMGIEVVDGFWTLTIYEFNPNNYFIVTNDIVGDGNDIQTYNYINNTLTPTKMVNWFSDFDYKLLVNNSTKCIQLLEDNQLGYTYNFSEPDTIEITSWLLHKEEAEHCFKGNTIIYQLNRENKTFDVKDIYWKKTTLN